MGFVLSNYKRELTDEEILEDIKQTAKRAESDYISISIYKRYGKYSQSAIQRHFGTWKNALYVAGLRTERNLNEYKRVSDSEYYEDFRRVSLIVGKNTVTYNDYKNYGKYSCEHVFKRFGEWDTALIKAGLQPTGKARKRISEQELFDEIERMWRVLGRQPTSTDFIQRNVSKYSIDVYKKRFGGWRKALEAFIQYIDNDAIEQVLTNSDCTNQVPELIDTTETEKDQNSTTEQERITHRTSRNINLRLRFKVLQRDNFKCCSCGASPAKDPLVKLHVDHIKPWSQGGETVIDNLQTYCSKCNLGKGDLYEP